MKDSKKMTTLLQVRLDVEERARLRGLARAEGLTTSAYIRKLALGTPHPNTCSAWDAAKLRRTREQFAAYVEFIDHDPDGAAVVRALSDEEWVALEPAALEVLRERDVAHA